MDSESKLNTLSEFLSDYKLILPSYFKCEGAKFWEFLIIIKYVHTNWSHIYSYFSNKEYDRDDRTSIEKCDYFFNKICNENLKAPITFLNNYLSEYQKYFYHLLSEFNQHQLKCSVEDLKNFEEQYNYQHSLMINSTYKLSKREIKKSTPLPNSIPSELVDIKKWRTGNEREDNKNFLGHGFFYHQGDCISKDINGVEDYDCLEDNFIKVENAKVAVCDYALLRSDFPEYLSEKSNEQINAWLLDQASYISEGQLVRISANGDLHEFLELSDPNLDINKVNADYKATRKSAFRYRGGGRAVNFLIDETLFFPNSNAMVDQNKNEILNSEQQLKQLKSNLFNIICEPNKILNFPTRSFCTGSFLNVKGVGTEKFAKGISPKLNGFLSFTDALKEYSYEKLINKLLKISKTESGDSYANNKKMNSTTVQTYAIIDLGIKYKDNIANPATSFLGDRCVLLIRQCSSRFVSGSDDFVYYSVVPEEQQKSNKSVNLLKQTLLKFGFTSEQIPLCFFSQGYNCEGDWNIQADATLTRFIDFSQFYPLPNTPLKKFKMSLDAFADGIKCCREAFNIVLGDKRLRSLVLGVAEKSEEDLVEELHKEKNRLKAKYGDKACKFNKSDYSWSWFLETDDSDVSKFALEIGKNGVEYDKFNADDIHRIIMSWIDF